MPWIIYRLGWMNNITNFGIIESSCKAGSYEKEKNT